MPSRPSYRFDRPPTAGEMYRWAHIRHQHPRYRGIVVDLTFPSGWGGQKFHEWAFGHRAEVYTRGASATTTNIFRDDGRVRTNQGSAYTEGAGLVVYAPHTFLNNQHWTITCDFERDPGSSKSGFTAAGICPLSDVSSSGLSRIYNGPYSWNDTRTNGDIKSRGTTLISASVVTGSLSEGPHIYTARKNAANDHELLLDYTAYLTSSTTWPSTHPFEDGLLDARYTLGFFHDDDPANNAESFADGFFRYARWYARRLSNTELRSLYEDPWLEYRPAKSWYFMPETVGPAAGLRTLQLTGVGI